MVLNPNKCQFHLKTIGFNEPFPIFFKLILQFKMLPRRTVFDNKVNFKFHLENICKKTNQKTLYNFKNIKINNP